MFSPATSSSSPASIWTRSPYLPRIVFTQRCPPRGPPLRSFLVRTSTMSCDPPPGRWRTSTRHHLQLRSASFLTTPKPHFLKKCPEWAKSREIPTSAKLWGTALVFPLIAGAVLVHLLPLLPEGWGGGNTKLLLETGEQTGEQTDCARTLLSGCVKYAAMLVAWQSAIHWGMQLAQYGLPKTSG